jgi:phospholipid transport system substrate-binding protein
LIRGFVRATVLGVLVLAAAPPAAWAGSPTEDLRGYVDRVIAVLDGPDLKGSALTGDRQRAVRSIASEGLDFTEAARRALGQHWGGRTATERTRFVALFTALIDGAYLSRVAGYNGERLRYDGESVTGDEAVVKTRVLEKDGGVTPLEFRLIRGSDDRWRVWDATFEGMSLVGSYRAQFSRIMRSSSFQQLMSRLEDRARPGGTSN